MQTSKNGIELIKKFEGCRLKAYKPIPTETYYTIGYGHYGQDVQKDMEITQEQADCLLKSDLRKFEGYVDALHLELDQNQFDALVSFTYNCGQGNLRTLVKNRDLYQIGDALLLYDKAGGKVLKGLTTRRKEERDLYFKDFYPVLALGSKGKPVEDLQSRLNTFGYKIPVTGNYGQITLNAVIEFQGYKGLKKDGIVGKDTYKALGMI